MLLERLRLSLELVPGPGPAPDYMAELPLVLVPHTKLIILCMEINILLFNVLAKEDLLSLPAELMFVRWQVLAPEVIVLLLVGPVMEVGVKAAVHAVLLGEWRAALLTFSLLLGMATLVE